MMKPTPFAAVVAGLLVQACSPGESECENVPLDTKRSPDGALVAVVFSRECGATTGRNVQVSVLPAAVAPTNRGNALIMDQAGDYDASHAPQWQADDALVLTIPKGARVFQQDQQVGEVSISYRFRGADNVTQEVGAEAPAAPN